MVRRPAARPHRRHWQSPKTFWLNIYFFWSICMNGGGEVVDDDDHGCGGVGALHSEKKHEK